MKLQCRSKKGSEGKAFALDESSQARREAPLSYPDSSGYQSVGMFGALITY